MSTEPLHIENFSVALTEDEHRIMRGERLTAKGGARFTERDFRAFAGKRSYRRQRGEYRTFA